MIKQSYESRKALEEAESIAASDRYFKARPQIQDTWQNRRIYDAGFIAAWYAREPKDDVDWSEALGPQSMKLCPECGNKRCPKAAF